MDHIDTEIDLIELFKTVWSEKKKIIKWGALGALIGLVIAFSIPKEYETVVKIAPESKSESGGLSSSMGGLAELAGVSVGGKSVDGVSEKIYPEILKSAPFLLELANIQVENDSQKLSFFNYITKEQKSPWWSYIISAPIKAVGLVVGLFSDRESKIGGNEFSLFEPTQEQVGYVNSLRKSITIETDKKLGILTITTTMQDPKIAAVIADSVLSNLQNYMVEYKTTKMRNDLQANIARLSQARMNYYRADSIYAAVMDKNQNLISQTAKLKLDRLENEKIVAFDVYQQLALQVESSQVKLQENTPIATVIEPASVALKASSPKKMMILIAFTFLGAFAAMISVVIKSLGVFSSSKPE